ncbi:max-binding protein MNT-like isoform X2 [Ischnura elegans]|uniref:max-binding protein MNT-like isoform X2 n=1 Tax=Ischnura elegans TaxID=197161 RepID=UPI001ED89B08|nr:max-binding protein MNT-like isoform X2 [Ischnura elegans]
MSLETLLEAARFLEFQDLAQTRGEIPKDYKGFSSSGPPTPPPPPPPPPSSAPGATPPLRNGLCCPSPPLVHASPPSSPPPPRCNLQPQHPLPHLVEEDGAEEDAAPPPSPPLKAAAPTTPCCPDEHPPASPPRAFRRISVSGQLARLEEAQELRRRVGSGTREVHNKLEKNRRAHLKECFELLKKQLPAAHDEKKSSNLSILHSALRHIQALRRRERDCEHEMERLAREKIAAQQRLSALKKELSAQWDHIDFNALLPQGPPDEPPPPPPPRPTPPPDHYSNSTSTASERGHVSDEEPHSADGTPNSPPRPLCLTPPSAAPLDDDLPASSQLSSRLHSRQEASSAPLSIATALVSPSAAPIHLVPSNHQRAFPGVVMAPSAHHLSPSPPSGAPSPQPLALTVHPTSPTPPVGHFHHSSRGVSLAHKSFSPPDGKPLPLVSSASMAATTISVPTIHLAGKVLQHPVAFLGAMASTAPRSPREMVSDVEAMATPSPKFPSSPHHHLHHPTTAVAIAAGGIALPNGVVAHTPSPGAGMALAPASGVTRATTHCPSTLTLSPTSSGITHLVTPLAGHAALVTTSGVGHPLMAPLALVSSTGGGPVAAHILGPASGSGPLVGAASVGTKVMSTGGGHIPLLKPLAMGGQLMNAPTYLTTAAALGGLAHLVKPLVVVSSAPSAAVPPKHHGGAKTQPSSSSSGARSGPSPPQ